VVPAGIAALTVLVFIPLLSCGFVWDDIIYLLGDADYRGFGVQQIRWMFTTTYYGNYQPLTWMTFALDHHLYGLEPWGYHWTNVLLHAANAGLVYVLLRELLRRFGPRPDGAPEPMVPAALGALLFALHPLRVETVAWVTERRGLLAGLGTLGCVLAYLRAHEDGRRYRRWLGVSLGAFVVALLSKGTSMSVPLVLIVLDWYPLRRFGRERSRPLLVEKIPYLMLAGAAAARDASAAFGLGTVMSFEEPHGLARRLAQATWGVGFYVQKTVFPLRLSPLYPLGTFDPSTPPVLVLLVGAIVFSLMAWRLRHRHPEVTAAWACYLILLAPTLGLVQVGVQAAADRYTYMATVPLIALVAAGLQALRTRSGRAWKAAAAVTVALAASLGVAARADIAVWHDSESLWGRVVQSYPGSVDAWHNLGVVRLGAGNARGALAAFDRAVALAPGFAPVVNSRAYARQALGDLPGALADWDRAIALAPEWADPYLKRANVRIASGDVAGAIGDYDRVLAFSPDHVLARYSRALARERQHDIAGARADMDAVIAASPDYANAYAMRARYRAFLGDVGGARADLERAAALFPAGSEDARTVAHYRAELDAKASAPQR
jgi:tetratricopeptide (TPR) repeat protein